MITQITKAGIKHYSYTCAVCGRPVKFETDINIAHEKLCGTCKIKKELKVKS